MCGSTASRIMRASAATKRSCSAASGAVCAASATRASSITVAITVAAFVDASSDDERASGGSR